MDDPAELTSEMGNTFVRPDGRRYVWLRKRGPGYRIHDTQRAIYMAWTWFISFSLMILMVLSTNFVLDVSIVTLWLGLSALAGESIAARFPYFLSASPIEFAVMLTMPVMFFAIYLVLYVLFVKMLLVFLVDRTDRIEGRMPKPKAERAFVKAWTSARRDANLKIYNYVAWICEPIIVLVFLMVVSTRAGRAPYGDALLAGIACALIVGNWWYAAHKRKKRAGPLDEKNDAGARTATVETAADVSEAQAPPPHEDSFRREVRKFGGVLTTSPWVRVGVTVLIGAWVMFYFEPDLRRDVRGPNALERNVVKPGSPERHELIKPAGMLTPDVVVRAFNDGVIRQYSGGVPADTTVAKWTQPLRLAVTGNLTSIRKEVEQGFDRVRWLTRHRIMRVYEGDDADIVIDFLPDENLNKDGKHSPETWMVRWDAKRSVTESYFYFSLRSARKMPSVADVVDFNRRYAGEEELSWRDVKRAKLEEAYLRAFGIWGDFPSRRLGYRISDDPGASVKNGGIASLEDLLLAVLYDPRIRPGMTADEAKPVIETIVAEMLAAGNLHDWLSAR